MVALLQEVQREQQAALDRQAKGAAEQEAQFRETIGVLEAAAAAREAQLQGAVRQVEASAVAREAELREAAAQLQARLAEQGSALAFFTSRSQVRLRCVLPESACCAAPLPLRTGAQPPSCLPARCAASLRCSSSGRPRLRLNVPCARCAPEHPLSPPLQALQTDLTEARCAATLASEQLARGEQRAADLRRGCEALWALMLRCAAATLAAAAHAASSSTAAAASSSPSGALLLLASLAAGAAAPAAPPPALDGSHLPRVATGSDAGDAGRCFAGAAPRPGSAPPGAVPHGAVPAGGLATAAAARAGVEVGPVASHPVESPIGSTYGSTYGSDASFLQDAEALWLASGAGGAAAAAGGGGGGDLWSVATPLSVAGQEAGWSRPGADVAPARFASIDRGSAYGGRADPRAMSLDMPLPWAMLGGGAAARGYAGRPPRPPPAPAAASAAPPQQGAAAAALAAVGSSSAAQGPMQAQAAQRRAAALLGQGGGASAAPAGGLGWATRVVGRAILGREGGAAHGGPAGHVPGAKVSPEDLVV